MSKNNNIFGCFFDVSRIGFRASLRPSQRTSLGRLLSWVLAAALVGLGGVAPNVARAAGPIAELYPTHLTVLSDFDDGTAASKIPGLKAPVGKHTIRAASGLFGSTALVGGGFSFSLDKASAKRHFDTRKPGTVLFWIKLTEDFPADIKADPGCTHFHAMWSSTKRMLVFRQDGKSCGASGQAPMSVYFHCPAADGKNYAIRSDIGPSFRNWKRGEWHLVAATWRPDGFALSYDGGPFKSVVSTEPLGPGVGNIGFSVPTAAGTGPGSCAMDDCAVLDFALSDDQVRELWDEYQARLKESPRVADDVRVELVSCAAKDESHYEIAVKATNPSAKPAEIVFAATAKPTHSQPTTVREPATLKPGQAKTFSLVGPCLNGETVVADFGVRTATDRRTLFRRHRTFAPNAPEPEWMRAPSAVSFKFAYYPYANTIHAAADVTGCEDFRKATALRLSVFAKGERTPLATRDFAPSASGRNELFWRGLPELDGEYVCRFEAVGLAGAAAEQTFLRRRFDWEHNRLGLSDAIPAPFTPVKREMARDRGGEATEKVSVVLRDHFVDPQTGLWKQVEAAGKPVLARPMRLTHPSSPIPHPSSLSTQSTWDVDGLMEWTLTLKPGRCEPLTLEIPLRAERAPLMHACVDGLRSNYAGKVPAGTGRVWASSEAPGRQQIVGDYVPYLWVGGPLRGLAVFGENDRGWVLDGKPCQEIVREADGTVVIRLNLVQKPCEIRAPRTIRLGFMATPVKPMAADWRSRDHGTLLGACWYWGGETACNSIEPFDGTDEYFRVMSEERRTGRMDKAYLERAVAAFPYAAKPGTVAWSNEVKTIRAHFNNGLSNAARAGETGRLAFYTNARGVHYGDPKGQGATFCNEWNRFEYMSRDIARKTQKAYDLHPNPSYRDYAAWWYAKMLATGACDYLYWDDVFLSGNFNLVQSDAYRLPDGSIQPATGVFDLRAMIRRAAVLQTELGRDATGNWVHMTNTAIAPICSFAGVNYDWEDMTGDRPHQEKYPKDYILACTIGRQFGNRVGIMGYFVHGMDNRSERGQWLQRTGAGVMLTHELRWNRWSGHDLYEKAHGFLCDWGYRTPAVEVWNYWDEDVPFPVAVSGVDAASIAMAKKGAAEAMVCVSSFEGRDGVVTLVPDARTLGLKDGWTAAHALTGEAVAVTDGRISLDLPKYDWILLKLK